MSVNTSVDNLYSMIDEVIKEYGTFNYFYSIQPQFRKGIDTVYYSGPYWDNKEIHAIFDSVLRGKWLSAGEKVAEFERRFSEQIGAKKSLMVNSGSSANLVMFASLCSKYGLTPENTQVITPVAGFPTTVNPIMQNGFVPTFVDVEESSLNIDLDRLVRVIDEKKEHHVVVFAHVLGNPPDMDRLQEILDEHKILFLEDCCDALGSKWRGKPLGSFGVLSTCSFYPSHHVCTGEGGMISTSDEELADIMRRFAWWGRDCYCVGAANLLPHGTCKKRFNNWLPARPELIVDHKYVFTEIGYNLKPLDLQGAIGLVQLDKLAEIHERRKKNFGMLRRTFEPYAQYVGRLCEKSEAEVSWFGFPIICKEKNLKFKMVEFFEKSKIQTRNYFAGNLLSHPAYSSFGDWKKFPVANSVYEKVFFIGCHPAMNDQHFEYVNDTVQSFFNSYA